MLGTPWRRALALLQASFLLTLAAIVPAFLREVVVSSLGQPVWCFFFLFISYVIISVYYIRLTTFFWFGDVFTFQFLNKLCYQQEMVNG